HAGKRPVSRALPADRRRACARRGPAPEPDRSPTDMHFRGVTISMMRQTILISAPLISFLAPQPAHAAIPLHGASLRWPWALPFVGILLTIATGPLLFPRVWHHHYGKLAFAWSVLTLAPLAIFHGISSTVAAFVHAMLAEYLSFIVLLFALYVVA